MHAVLKTVSKTVAKHHLFDQSTPLLVSFSGGVDSVVVLHALVALGYNVQRMVYFNHHLRPESCLKKDLDLAKVTAAQFGIAYSIKSLPLQTTAARFRCSIEHAGHILRKTIVQHLARLYRCSCIVTGHHLDDVYETCLLQFQRGSFFHLGLPAKQCDATVSVCRPLYDLTKKDIYAYAAAHHLAYQEDKSNTSLVFARNKIRHDLIPVIKQVDPAILQHLHACLAHMQSLQTPHSQQSLITLSIQEYVGYYSCALLPLKQVSRDEGARMLYRLLRGIARLRYPKRSLKSYFLQSPKPARTHITTLLDAFYLKKTGLIVELPGACPVYLSKQGALIVPVPERVLQPAMTLTTQWQSYHTNYSVRMQHAREKPLSYHSTPTSCVVDSDGMQTTSFSIRMVQQTDIFIPYGQQRPVPVYRYLAKKQVPIWKRHAVAVVLVKEQICWVVGYTIDDRFAVSETTQRTAYIQIRILTTPIEHMLSCI